MSKGNVIDTVEIDGVYVAIDTSNEKHIKAKKTEVYNIKKQEKLAIIKHKTYKKQYTQKQQDNLSEFISGFKNCIGLLNKFTSLTKFIK